MKRTPLLILLCLMISGCGSQRTPVVAPSAPPLVPPVPSTAPAVPESSPLTTAAAPAPTPAPEVSATPRSTPAPATPVPAATPSPEALKKADALVEKARRLLVGEGRYQDAVSACNDALSLVPDHGMAMNLKGVNLCFLGQSNAGLPLLKKSVTLVPTSAYAHFNLALGYKLVKDYDSALTAFDRSLALDSTDPWTWYGKATIYGERGQAESCVEHLKRALALDAGVREVARREHEFDPVRGNESFDALLR